MFAISNLVLKFEDAMVGIIPFGFTDCVAFLSCALGADFEKMKYIVMKNVPNI